MYLRKMVKAGNGTQPNGKPARNTPRIMAH